MPSSIPTTNVWPYYAAGNTSAAKEAGNDTLGKDAFLKILITQLQNQDPMQPMEDKEFIAQMAQFSTVEQIQQMGLEMKWMRQAMGISSDLIGKEIEWEEFDHHHQIVVQSGIVQSILFSDGIQYVQVDGQRVPIDQLISVKNATSEQAGQEDE